MNCKHPEESIEAFEDFNHGHKIYFCRGCGNEVTKLIQYVPDGKPVNHPRNYKKSPDDCEHKIEWIKWEERLSTHRQKMCRGCGSNMLRVYSYRVRGLQHEWIEEPSGDCDYTSDPLTDGGGPGSWEAGRVDYTGEQGEPALVGGKQMDMMDVELGLIAIGLILIFIWNVMNER